MNELYIGLMSGTSADGIDAALVDFSKPTPVLLNTHYQAYSEELREKIFALCQKGENEIERMGILDIVLGKAFAEAAMQLLEKSGVASNQVKAIGSHGQTIRHLPQQAFTLQIGDPNIIAALTSITTIADFRRKDMALGGQGAPLVPAFHHHLFANEHIDRVIVNIGGIANITCLPKNKDSIIGFDTGPGNALMDAWIDQHSKKRHDQNGEWAAKGAVQRDLLKNMLADRYFHLPAPKSTGREYFNLTWLQQYLTSLNRAIDPPDVQATLVELTAQSILLAVSQHFKAGEILVCGGGVQNVFLMSRLQDLTQNQFSLASTQKYGIDPNWVEAIAFAWLARQTINKKHGNIPRVTGARETSILGGIYFAG